MNTKASVAYGWGVLIVAGAGSYYFAKRSVNSDRLERAERQEQQRQQRERMRVQEMMAANPTKPSSATVTGPANTKRKGDASANEDPDTLSPSRQNGDPAPVTHTQEEMARRGGYEAAEPFRSRKGDRFS